MTTKINALKTELFNKGIPVSSVDLINFVNGLSLRRNKVLEEFLKHNEKIMVLVIKKEYSKGIYTRYVTARSHVQDFIKYKFERNDIEFTALNYEFAKNYYMYLRTVQNCSNNTAIKYISIFKTIN